MSMSITNKLKRLKKHIVTNEKEPEQNSVEPEQKTQIPYLIQWEELGIKPFYFEDQYALVRTVEYPVTHQHGLYKLKEFEEVVRSWNRKKVIHPLSAEGHDPHHLFFFDTETTGLKGGAGNMIFLLGHARLNENRIVIKQHFLPGPGHEVALYKSFLSEVNIEKLVTYNGKAFDWPQVKSRHAFIREKVPKLPSFGHFDLYHASRRLWKDRLESVRLTIVEKEILNINRNEDTPGYLAPMLYFHFLKTQDPKVLEGVFKHNELDVLSLITLYTHISKKLLNADQFQEESYYLAKWFQAAGNKSQALETYKHVEKDDHINIWKAKFEQSILYKQEKNDENAVLLWKEIVSSSPLFKERVLSYIELAKYYEHRKKDLNRAIKVVTEAYQYLINEEMKAQTKRDKYLSDILKRETRLKKKIERLLSK